MTTIHAASRYDLAALVEVRKALEAGAEVVTVEFAVHEVGKPSTVQFTPADLKTIYYRLIVSV